MRRLLVTALLAALATPAVAQRPGTYTVTGTNPEGTEYAGTVQLQASGTGGWRLVWQVGGEPIEGIGLNGANGTFSSAYIANNRPGICVYQVLPNGVLAGQWTVGGSGLVGTETLTPR